MQERTKSKMMAIVIDPDSAKRLVMRKTHIPIAAPGEALIKVKAFSLNQGETRTALAATTSYTPGWDFAGIVEKAATDGSTPKEGSRVFGYVARGSWAEYVVAPGGLMAEIPEGLSYDQAATLPIAGITAMGCLDASGELFNRSILITGASGGVGRFACQLAMLAGGKVFAVSRRSELSEALRGDGVEPAEIFVSVADAKRAGSYDLIWDSIGGKSLGTALSALSRNGICVNYGNSSRQPTTFDVRAQGWPLHEIKCIWLGREPILKSTPILNRLADLVKQQKLRTPIDTVLPWSKVAQAAGRLLEQRVNGKIVLEIDS